MHKTEAGERAKALKKEAEELERQAEHLEKAREDAEARSRQDQAGALKAEAGSLQPVARLEDLNVWQMENIKTTKKGSRSYLYWMAGWREGGKVKTTHLGSCRNMSQSEALQKARSLKAAALGL